MLANDEAAERFRREAARQQAEKGDIRKVAGKLEADGKAANEKSDASMHVHHRWAQAMTLVQLAISLAAITLPARRRWLQYAAYGTGVAGGNRGGRRAMRASTRKRARAARGAPRPAAARRCARPAVRR